jgi:hypothetical protein
MYWNTLSTWTTVRHIQKEDKKKIAAAAAAAQAANDNEQRTLARAA